MRVPHVFCVYMSGGSVPTTPWETKMRILKFNSFQKREGVMLSTKNKKEVSQKFGQTE